MKPLNLALAGLLAFGATSAAADPAPGEHDFYFKGGVFFSWVDSTMRIDASELELGTEIDLESDLGLESKKALPFGRIGWRFSDDWQLEAEYFALSRTSTATLDREIIIDDTTYPVNGEVSAGLKTRVARLGVGYSFINRPNFELGALLGAHVSDFSVFVEGSGRVGEEVGTVRREQRDQLVPLPTIGLFGRFALNETFSIGGRFDIFQLKIDDYRGQLIDTSAGVSARLTKNIGVGADFRYVNYELTANARDFSGRVDYNFYGPYLYMTVGF